MPEGDVVKKFRWSLHATVTAATLAGAPAARAAVGDVCVRQAEALPGEKESTPEWWTKELSPSKKEGRWLGATTRTGGQGAAPQLARSRMVWDKTSRTVYLEFEVSGDPTFDPAKDFVMLALSKSDGKSPQLFAQFLPLKGYEQPTKDKPTIDGPVNPGADPHAVTYWSSDDFNAVQSLPTYYELQVSHPWVKVDRVGSDASPTYNWTLSLALTVPVKNGGEIRDNLRIYGNVMMSLGQTRMVQFPLLCNPPAGEPNACLMQGSGTYIDQVPTPTALTTWPVLRSGDSSCGGVEVIRELVGSDVGVTNGFVPGTNVSYPLPGPVIPRASGANFRVGFYNNTGLDIGSGSIEAEIYVANWGLQWGQAGTEIDAKTATWSRILPGTTIALQGDVKPGRYAGEAGQGKIETPQKWIPNQSGLALSAGHQCMFVRLKSSAGGVPFAVDSVYRNMYLTNASVARRPATIDLGDRPLPKGKDEHEVYLLVRTEHMPDVATCDAARGKLYGCAKGGRLLRERRALSKAQKQALRAEFAAGRTDLDQEQLDALLQQKDRKGTKIEELPFVVVYGLVDTGLRIDMPGAPKTPVLEQFSEFGYYVEHEGDLEGWETLMHGAEPVPGTPNLFKLEIEPKKVATVANTVRVLSKETKACRARPHARLGVANQRKTEELEAKLLADVGKGDLAAMRKVRVTDDQLGCDPPPLRQQCRLKRCGEHSPAAFIEGSRYVGDWTALERRKRVKPSEQPDAKPAARPSPTVKPKAGG